jgi:hypothetical protein
VAGPRLNRRLNPNHRLYKRLNREGACCSRINTTLLTNRFLPAVDARIFTEKARCDWSGGRIASANDGDWEEVETVHHSKLEARFPKNDEPYCFWILPTRKES